MVKTLKSNNPVVLNTEFLFRKASETDFECIKLLQPEGWRDISPNIAFYFQNPNNCHLFVVEKDDQIVGCGAVILHKQSAWLGHIIVSPTQRGKGLGSTITRYLINEASKHTNYIRLIATRLGHPVYSKLGFVDDGHYRFFNAGENPVYPPRPANIVPFQPHHEQALLALDEDTTGEKRDWLLRQHFHHTWVYEENGGLAGFTIPELGEGLTLAYTHEAGIALMMLVLQQHGRIALPENNATAIAAVLKAGFIALPEAYGVKMRYGQFNPWKPNQTFGRIAGNLG